MSMGDRISHYATHLEPTDQVKFYFAEQPPSQYVQVVVKIQAPCKRHQISPTYQCL
jgi:hypothetical protein